MLTVFARLIVVFGEATNRLGVVVTVRTANTAGASEDKRKRKQRTEIPTRIVDLYGFLANF